MDSEYEGKYLDALAGQLRAAKAKKQVSFDTLAALTGYAKSSLSGYFSGAVDIPASRLETVARALGTTGYAVLRRVEAELQEKE